MPSFRKVEEAGVGSSMRMNFWANRLLFLLPMAGHGMHQLTLRVFRWVTIPPESRDHAVAVNFERYA